MTAISIFRFLPGSAGASLAGNRPLAIANFWLNVDFGEAQKSAGEGACAPWKKQ